MTEGGLLSRSLALATTQSGHPLPCNAQNGRLVEINPVVDSRLFAQSIDTNGNLFGIAMRLNGQGYYYVRDENNFLMEGRSPMTSSNGSPHATRRGPLTVGAGLTASRKP